MDEASPTRARQIARAASDFERRRTGRAPTSVAVALAGETVVVTLGGSLSAAERDLAGTPTGTVLLRDFHRALFATNSRPLLLEVARITGTEVREASVEVQG